MTTKQLHDLATEVAWHLYQAPSNVQNLLNTAKNEREAVQQAKLILEAEYNQHFLGKTEETIVTRAIAQAIMSADPKLVDVSIKPTRGTTSAVMEHPCAYYWKDQNGEYNWRVKPLWEGITWIKNRTQTRARKKQTVTLRSARAPRRDKGKRRT